MEGPTPDKDGWTSIHLAAENGHTEIVQILASWFLTETGKILIAFAILTAMTVDRLKIGCSPESLIFHLDQCFSHCKWSKYQYKPKL